jgi:Arc-like DNA binding domain
VARKDQELRPVMTRIPEGLRRRLEREAKWHRRSMNAEIIDRLQKSFDAPDLTAGIVEDVSSEIDSLGYSLGEDAEKIKKSLDDVRSDIRAILAHLGVAQPKDEGEGQASKAQQNAQTKAAALELAIQTLERAGFSIARPKPDAEQPKDDGEKK